MEDVSPWLLLPSPRVLLVGPDEASRELTARLLTDPVELLAKGISECLPALEAFRPDVVLFADTDAVPFDAFRIGALARGDAAPILVVVAATPDVETAALVADVDEVLRAGDPEALNRKRFARVLHALDCRRREGLAREMLDAVDTGIAVAEMTRPDSPVVYLNAAWERSTGLARTSILGRNASLLQLNGTSDRAVDEIRRLVEAGEEGRVVVEDPRDDGALRAYELGLVPVRNESRRITHYVGLRRDVSDRRRFAELERRHEDLEAVVRLRTRSLESALEALEARGFFMETVLDAMTAGVLAVDASSAVTLANQAALQILEIPREACIGVPVLRLLQSGPELMEALASLLPGTERRVEVTYTTPSGRTIEIGMSAVATKASTVLGRPGFWRPPERAANSGRADDTIEIDRPLSFLLLFRDIGHQRQFESELRRVNALTAVGQMAAGFAHEIRNPLAAIRSLSDNLLTELSEDDDRREYATRIVALTRRLERFVRTSLRFAQPREPAPRSCSPDGLAEDALEVFATRFKPGTATPVLQTGPAVPKVSVDPDQIVEVLVALVDNALDVVVAPDHVRLRVEVAGPAEGVDEGSCVAIEVADDGPGIPPDLQARVFDPFFTTKPKGTGLGLSIAQRIVRNNRGHLRLTSRPGETRFRILLPVAEP